MGYRLGTRMIGGGLKLTVLRDGKTLKRTLALVSAPEVPPRNVSQLKGRSPLAGATVANLSPALAEELGLDTLAHGVIVLDVSASSPAHRLQLKAGDFVLKVNGQEIDRVATLRNAVEDRRREWQLSVRRGERTFNLAVRG